MHLDEIAKAVRLILETLPKVPKILSQLEKLIMSLTALDARLEVLEADIDKVVVLVPALKSAIDDLTAKSEATPELEKVNALITKLESIVPADESAPTEPAQ